MALMAVRTIVATGGAITRSAVTASDTIPGDQLGNDGIVLDVNNGGGVTDNVTVVDPGATPSGNPAATSGRVIAIAAGAQRQIFIGPQSINPATGLVTVLHSSITTVTAEAYRY